MGKETEFKYASCGISRDALFNCEYILPYRGDIRKIDMHTRYLDTTDGACRKNKLSLRIRCENGVFVATAKTGGSRGALSVRDEWSVLCGDISDAAKKLCDVGAPCGFLTGAELITQGEVIFTRHECDVACDGVSFVLSYDEGTFNEKHGFCEIELELKEGSEALFSAFAEKLSASLSLSPEPRSKHSRALLYR